MARNRRAVLELLASVADGQPVDWISIETETVGSHRTDLRVLRAIAGVAEVHRSLPDVAPLDSARSAPGRIVGKIGPSDERPPAHADPERWGPFILVERLGSGASADVYRAYEPRLDRHVALKLFKPGAASNHDRRATMLREARALARVRHENVVQVHGADEIDGTVGIWMELVAGRTLEAEIRERGRWSECDAAAAGQELCKALAAVHAAGFVHGDVKAQNVARQDGGRIMLMDFGARQTRHGTPGNRLSGTPVYLAPEVLCTSSPSVESDIYSLGVLMYYLVTGSYPVVASSLETLRERHQRGDVVRIADARPDLDKGFVRVVERALAQDPSARFHTAADMGAALASVGTTAPIWSTPVRWWLPLVALTTVVLGLAGALQWNVRPAPSGDASVAVLPFRTVGGQGDAEYLSEGVSADLTSLLSRLPDVHVVSGMSVQQFKNTDKRPQEIGTALGARTLVAGIVQVSGNVISVNVELIDTTTATQLWGQRFDRNTRDLFSIQSEIARSIAASLRGRLSSRDAQLLERAPMQYHAFELYSLGRYHWSKRTPEGLRQSIRYFEQAAQADPASGLPYAGLSDAYVLSAVYGLFSPRDAQVRAEAAALRAVELDPDLAEAFAALGSIRQEQLRWAEAEAAFVRAIQLKPGYSSAHHWYALYLTSRGHFPEAVNQMQQAAAQDPLSVAVRAALGFVYYMSGDFRSSLNEYRRALQLETDRHWLHRHMALAFAADQALEEALSELDQVPPETEIALDLNAIRAYVYALAGRVAEARLLVVPLDTPASPRPFSAIEQASARFALGDRSDGYIWLARAIENREHDIQYLAVDPRFQALRGEPQYLDLLKRTGLEGTSGGIGR